MIKSNRLFKKLDEFGLETLARNDVTTNEQKRIKGCASHQKSISSILTTELKHDETDCHPHGDGHSSKC